VPGRYSRCIKPRRCNSGATYSMKSTKVPGVVLYIRLTPSTPASAGPPRLATTLFRPGGTSVSRPGREVAEAWAQSPYPGGRFVLSPDAPQLVRRSRILLETVAPPNTNICRVGSAEDRYGESEYLVDRRRLLLHFRLPRACCRPIAFTETLAVSAIPPLDETRSEVVAPAIAGRTRRWSTRLSAATSCAWRNHRTKRESELSPFAIAKRWVDDLLGIGRRRNWEMRHGLNV